MKFIFTNTLFFSFIFCNSSNQPEPKPLAFDNLSLLKSLIENLRTDVLPKKLPNGSSRNIIQGFLQFYENELQIKRTDTSDLDKFWMKRRTLLDEWKNKRTADRKVLETLQALPELKTKTV